MAYIFIPLLAYLIGSVPFGLILARLGGHGDLRNIGSGNIGATNVMRTGDTMLAAFTLILDLLKGAFAVMIAYSYSGFGDYLTYVAAFAAVLGHNYPIWLRFKGGKGVATTAGVLCGLSFQLGMALVATWAVVFALKRTSSVASLSAAVLAPIYALILEDWKLALITLAFGGLIFFRHRANIQRLRKGTEHGFSSKQ